VPVRGRVWSTGVDGEIAETVAEQTEKPALNQPACLIKAAEQLTRPELDQLVLHLRNPLFNSNESIEARLFAVP
jgi:hypothetical protein